MIKVYDISELPECFDWKNKPLVLIGRGKENNKYKFDLDKVILFTVNDTCLFYQEAKQTVIVEAHWVKNFPIVNKKIEHCFFMTRRDMKKYDLVVGSTPSLFLSYVVKYTPVQTIYLQGFSMDGISPINDPYPYDWHRQEIAMRNVYNLAFPKGIKMGFITPCRLCGDIPRLIPDEQYLLKEM